MTKLASKFSVLGIVLLLGCNADLGTKYWASSQLKEQGSMTVVPDFFDLHYAENDAIAFSFLSDLSPHVRTPLIFALNFLALVFMGYLAWRWRRESLNHLIPLGLILSGALGNIIDRVGRGYVVDFIFFHYQDSFYFPIFNLADILIFVGVVWLLINMFRKPKIAG